MTKYSGLIGYSTQVETSPGIWVNDIIEESVRGEVLRMSYEQRASKSVNDDVTLNHTFSIISSSIIENNIHNMKYISFLGTNWKIISVEINRPRITITTGGVWNG